MGNSLQDYRVQVGLFHNSAFCFKSRTSQRHGSPSKNLKTKPKMKIVLLVCLLLACFVSNSRVRQEKAHFSQDSPSYPTIICVDRLVYLVGKPHLSPGGADDPLDPGEQAQWDHVHQGQYGGTELYPCRRCSFLTKSTNIEDYNFLARYRHGNRRSSGIKLCHWNKGGAFLINSMNEIEQVITQHRPHVLGISESNFLAKHNIEDVQINDYNLILADTIKNPNLNISRVAVYIHKDVVVKVRNDLMSENFSSIWLEVGLRRQKKFLVSNIYREWQFVGQVDQESGTLNSQLLRWDDFLQQWENAIASDSEIHVLGDFNLNFLEFHTESSATSAHSAKLRPLVEALQQRAVPHGFSQLVTDMTRIRQNQTPALLDHHWTNRPEKVTNVQTFFQGGSDHKLIFAVRQTKNIISKPRIIKKRSFKNFKSEDFVAAVRIIKWFDVYMSNDVEVAIEIVTQRLTEVLDQMAPIKTFQSRSNYAPWVSDNTKNKIKERNEAQKKASETKTSSDWEEYKKLRNQVNSILKAEKRTWQENKISSYGSDSSSVWKNIKNWLGWSKGGPPSKLLDNGTIFTKPSDLARIMNLFFINKVKNLRQNLPNNPGNPLLLLETIMQNRSCSFKLAPVHPDTVLKIISNLKMSSACGTDEISSGVLKLIKYEISPVLTHIINLSISNQTFPSLWKTAKVIPLHKKNETLLPKNYRPVSLLPVLSKVTERCIFLQMSSYLEDNNLLHPSHHGFRSKHSTATALIQMFDSWMEAFENDEVSAVIMLDMSAAFDVVDYDILLSKLALYGFEESVLAWIRSYLSGRYQCVSLEGCLSEPLSLECGVPQGSILGPLLYIIYTNDLPEVVHQDCHPQENSQEFHSNHLFHTHCQDCGGLCLYADDSTYTLSSSDTEGLNANLDAKYKVIEEYMNKNKLILNSDKTHLLVMASERKHQIHDNFGISLNTGKEIIEPQNDEKLLGATVSNNLSWKTHIRDSRTSLINTLTSRINALYKVSQYSTFLTRKMVANGMFMSYLSYIIPLIGGSPEYLLTALQTSQNRAARLVTKSDWGTSSSSMLSQIGWLSVRQQVVFQSLMMIFKAKQDKKPVYLYQQISSKFSMNTRLGLNNGIKDKRIFKSTLGSQSFTPRSIKQWNSLPTNIRTESSIVKFKSKLRAWVKLNS